MRFVFAPFRFITMLLMVVAFLVTMSTVFFFARDHWARVRWSNRILKQFTIFGLKVLKISVRYFGLEHAQTSGLWVGNHLSYIDVLVIHAHLPACFVTSEEIRETPVLGKVCEMAGCLFVERRSRTNILKEVSEIAEGLRRDFNVAIFPEATSTNGEAILRFRRPLFVAAILARRPVIPFCLNYRRVGRMPIDRVNRDSIFWYGDMGFASHLWRLSVSGGVGVDMHFLNPIPTAELGIEIASDEARDLATLAHSRVTQVFLPV